MLDAVREERMDQASGLRRLFRPRGLRVLPFASAVEQGRDPVELARAFARAGERVLVLDHGWGCAAAHASEAPDLAAVLRGAATYESAATRIAENIEIMKVGSGFTLMKEGGMRSEQLFVALRERADMVLVPTRAPYAVAAMLGGIGEFLLLAGATGAGISSTYRMLKAIVARAPRVRLVFDGVERQTIAENAFRRIESTAARFLGVVPLLGGWLPRESLVTTGHSAGDARATRQTADRIARAALQWQLAEFPSPRPLAELRQDSSAMFSEAPERWSGVPHGVTAGEAAGEARGVPVKTVRRARTRREW